MFLFLNKFCLFLWWIKRLSTKSLYLATIFCVSSLLFKNSVTVFVPVFPNVPEPNSAIAMISKYFQ